ncbi:unnamed protein product [Arctogadus glacialis]
MDRIPWLTLKAAIGLRISYIGYAVLDFAVGGIEVTNKGIVMVEDSSMGTECGLLGMNVIKDCWENLFLNGHPGEMAFKSTVPQASVNTWDTAVAICKRIQAPEEPLQVMARQTQRSPISIPPRLSWAQGGAVPFGSTRLDPRSGGRGRARAQQERRHRMVGRALNFFQAVGTVLCLGPPKACFKHPHKEDQEADQHAWSLVAHIKVTFGRVLSCKTFNYSQKKKLHQPMCFQSKAKSPEQQERADSPGPSCVFMKSDCSTDLPLGFNDGNQSTENRIFQQDRADCPGPSCVSMERDCSTIVPLSFNAGSPFIWNRIFQQERADCPGPSCVSMETDLSMAQHPDSTDGNPQPSKKRKVEVEIAEGEIAEVEIADTPGPSCVSMQSDSAMSGPPEFKDGRPSGEERPHQERLKDTSAQSVRSIKQTGSRGLRRTHTLF